MASLPFPVKFLRRVDQYGKIGFHKTTTLEIAAIVVALALFPFHFAGNPAVFIIDNIGVSYVWRAAYSKDLWASTLARAGRIVAAFIGTNVVVQWSPRRSDRPTEVADDLTHQRVSSLTSEELLAYIENGGLDLPPPLKMWMGNPKPDAGLGLELVNWMKSAHSL